MFDEAVGCCLLVAIRSGPANEKAPEARIMKTQKSRVPPWESPLLHRPLCFFCPFLGHSPAGYLLSSTVESFWPGGAWALKLKDKRRCWQ